MNNKQKSKVVRVADALHARCKRHAGKTGMKLESVVERAITQYMELVEAK